MADENKQDIIEEALDIAEEQVEVVVKSAGLLRRIIWNHKTHVGVAFAVGAGLGAGVAYKVTVAKMQYRFDELLTEEVAKTKEHYDRRYMTGDYETPEKAAEKLLGKDRAAQEAHEALRDYQGGEGVVGETPENREEVENLIREEVKLAKRRNIFASASEEFDWEEETARREALSDAEPYIITFEEHLEDEEMESKQLTYYEEDDTLADEDDKALTDDQEEGLIGDNLRFGYGSKDPNIVYIRNPRVGLNMEVVRSTGSYAVEVLGLDKEPEDELRHSQRRPAGRKFRASDE